ncbi:MAG: protein kinase [Deltaproteobacteria bacterium]|nr:protein kinase [Deltaproteobacteria bacterium]
MAPSDKPSFKSVAVLGEVERVDAKDPHTSDTRRMSDNAVEVTERDRESQTDDTKLSEASPLDDISTREVAVGTPRDRSAVDRAAPVHDYLPAGLDKTESDRRPAASSQAGPKPPFPAPAPTVREPLPVTGGRPAPESPPPLPPQSPQPPPDGQPTAPAFDAGAGAAGLPAGVPKTIGRYHLVTEIASGGMAALYLARATGPAGFEKLVALKRIHPHLARESQFVVMFLDEARIAARIRHPNVVQIYELGEDAGSYFIAMEYIEGESLARLASATWRGQHSRGESIGLPLPEMIHIVAEAASGLHAAHELRDEQGATLGLVHRDVSPHNVLVTYDGYIKLVDFGVVKARGRMTQTTTSELKGKLAYMSPEQLGGCEIDRRSDIFSLGVVLYEMTVSRRLFKSASEGHTVAMILQGAIPPPSQVVPDYPLRLEKVVLKSLARDPADRYQTAEEMQYALHDVLDEVSRRIGAADVARLMRTTFGDRYDLRQRLRAASEAGEEIGDRDLARLGDSKTLDHKTPSISGIQPTVLSRLSRLVRRRKKPVAVASALASACIVVLAWLLLAQPFAPAVGTVRVVSEPPAAVYFDGRGPLGNTPITIPEVAVGEHNVTVEADGYRQREKLVEIKRPGQDLVVELVLAPLQVSPPTSQPVMVWLPPDPAPDRGRSPDPKPDPRPIVKQPAVNLKKPEKAKPPPPPKSTGTGLLTLDTKPWCVVRLDGKKLGMTPLIEIRVASGEHELELLPAGVGPGRKYKIVIQKGEPTRLFYDLNKK